MGRKKMFDANGCSLKTGSTVIGGITEMSIPGWSRQEIDDTELGNVNYTTAVLGNLKTADDFTCVIKLANSGEVSVGNKEYTITLPDSAGTLVFWADLKQFGATDAKNAQGLTLTLTFKVTNLNAAGVETIPVLTLAQAA
ncbi:MAG: hypothetical protein PHI35_07235 [Victivallaceae bacterium]|nr:hypothetical protein [Victivallaceae bacterium]